jgi:hypothetical protein
MLFVSCFRGGMSVDVEVHVVHYMGTPQKATLEGLLIVWFPDITCPGNQEAACTRPISSSTLPGQEYETAAGVWGICEVPRYFR